MVTGVVDLGKTHSRLVLLGPDGETVDQWSRPSASCRAAGGWMALDTETTWAWLLERLAALGRHRERLDRLIVTTHGATVAAVRGDQLALPVPDYEFDGFGPPAPALVASLDPFEATLSPLLPRGLNLGVQLDWLERHEPEAFARVDGLLPYPQYWAWRLSGERASEVSSLGCHSLLWEPGAGGWSGLARARGWDRLFAPMRPAWGVLGLLRPELASRLGLRHGVRVHVGAHDSNACLARWIRRWPRMTLVSSGTWVVAMAVGASPVRLDADADELANVSVRNELVPTARFMGGRELQAICGDADPRQADLDTMRELIARGTQVMPGFSAQGGAFRDREGFVVDGGVTLRPADLPPRERATAAAIFLGQLTAHAIRRLGGMAPVLLEGPLAANDVVVSTLASLLPPGALHVVRSAQEGTVTGAFMLAHWTEPPRDSSIPEAVCPPPFARAVSEHFQHWLAAVRRAEAPGRTSGDALSVNAPAAARRPVGPSSPVPTRPVSS